MNAPFPAPHQPLLGLSQRIPPANIGAEQALLGAILANNKAYDLVSSFLRPDHFAAVDHAKIYQAIARHIEGGRNVDAITLKNDFENSGVLNEVGGTAYLAQLLSAMVGIINAVEYGRSIHDCWLRRQMIDRGERLVNEAFGDDSDLSGVDVLTRHEDEISALREQSVIEAGASKGAVTLRDAVKAALDRAEGMAKGSVARPISTGLPSIDRMLGGGIYPDTVNSMVGAGGSGKTELALQIAETVAENAYAAWVAGGSQGMMPGVLYGMLGDMTAEQVGVRTAARLAEMRTAPIRYGSLSMDHGDRLVRADKRIDRIPLEITETGPATIGRVLGDIRRFRQKRRPVLIVVDNLYNALAGSPDRMFGTAINFTAMLKAQCPKGASILLLQHLTGSSKDRKDKVPKPAPSDNPYATRSFFDFMFGVFRPGEYLEPEPPTLGTKKLTDPGKELEAKWLKEWSDKREPWPVGVADVTELVSMKMREDGGRESRKPGVLIFRDGIHRYIDAEAQPDQLPMDAPSW